MYNAHAHFRVFVFLLLCIGAVGAYYSISKYTEIGEQLLANHDFAGGLQGWQVGSQVSVVVASPGLLRLQSNDLQTSVQVTQRFNPALLGERVVLKGKIKTIGIQDGKEGWEKGRVFLVQGRWQGGL